MFHLPSQIYLLTRDSTQNRYLVSALMLVIAFGQNNDFITGNVHLLNSVVMCWDLSTHEKDESKQPAFKSKVLPHNKSVNIMEVGPFLQETGTE